MKKNNMNDEEDDNYHQTIKAASKLDNNNRHLSLTKCRKSYCFCYLCSKFMLFDSLSTKLLTFKVTLIIYCCCYCLTVDSMRVGSFMNSKPCQNAIGETGTCMFMWDCIKSDGKHLGTCSDRFLFGSCCFHNTTSMMTTSSPTTTSTTQSPLQTTTTTTSITDIKNSLGLNSSSSHFDLPSKDNSFVFSSNSNTQLNVKTGSNIPNSSALNPTFETQSFVDHTSTSLLLSSQQPTTTTTTVATTTTQQPQPTTTVATTSLQTTVQPIDSQETIKQFNGSPPTLQHSPSMISSMQMQTAGSTSINLGTSGTTMIQNQIQDSNNPNRNPNQSQNQNTNLQQYGYSYNNLVARPNWPLSIQQQQQQQVKPNNNHYFDQQQQQQQPIQKPISWFQRPVSLLASTFFHPFTFFPPVGNRRPTFKPWYAARPDYSFYTSNKNKQQYQQQNQQLDSSQDLRPKNSTLLHQQPSLFETNSSNLVDQSSDRFDLINHQQQQQLVQTTTSVPVLTPSYFQEQATDMLVNPSSNTQSDLTNNSYVPLFSIGQPIDEINGLSIVAPNNNSNTISVPNTNSSINPTISIQQQQSEGSIVATSFSSSPNLMLNESHKYPVDNLSIQNNSVITIGNIDQYEENLGIKQPADYTTTSTNNSNDDINNINNNNNNNATVINLTSIVQAPSHHNDIDLTTTNISQSPSLPPLIVDQINATQTNSFFTNNLSTANNNINSIHRKPSLVSTNKQRDACGTTAPYPQKKVVGGKNAAFGAWPWQVSVRKATFFGLSSTHRCGGAIISSEWIATAGHCVDDLNLATIRIRVGEYDFNSNSEPYPYVEGTAKRKVVHPKYNLYTYENDLALVQLDQPLRFAPHVAPICLPPDEIELLGRNATVTGWGRLNEGGILPTVLQEVRVPIVSNDKCKNMFSTAGRPEYIPDIFLCAGYEEGGRDSCQGDSGGPLQVRGDDGKWFLAGIISWGIGCAERNLPGVCTRISRYKQWMQATMN